MFSGEKNHFPSAVFRTKEEADSWITRYGLAGTLTRYPVGIAVYDWAISAGAFVPTAEKDRSPAFIANFSTAAQPHYHYGSDAA